MEIYGNPERFMASKPSGARFARLRGEKQHREHAEKQSNKKQGVTREGREKQGKLTEIQRKLKIASPAGLASLASTAGGHSKAPQRAPKAPTSTST